MKRSTLVEKLIKEGFSEKTLVNFNDKQLSDLHERIITTTRAMAANPEIKKLAMSPNTDVEVKEDLKGGQNKIDKNHNGKIDGQDFKILRSKKKEVKEGEMCEKCDCEKSKCKCKKSEVKEWVEKLVENKYHSFTSKNEIMELIQTKLDESDTMVQNGPKVKKGHNGVPEFMTYDSIVTAAESNSAPATKPAPTKPKESPITKPRTPYSPKPGEKSKPKALKEKEVKNEVK